MLSLILAASASKLISSPHGKENVERNSKGKDIDGKVLVGTSVTQNKDGKVDMYVM